MKDEIRLGMIEGGKHHRGKNAPKLELGEDGELQAYHKFQLSFPNNFLLREPTGIAEGEENKSSPYCCRR
jgi:hypothetical protein